jgi:hypothetical protein
MALLLKGSGPGDTNVFSTYGFASTVVSCLHPFTMVIGQLLHDQMESGPPLVPDNVHDAEEFVSDWMTTLKDTACQRRRDRTAGRLPQRRPASPTRPSVAQRRLFRG